MLISFAVSCESGIHRVHFSIYGNYKSDRQLFLVCTCTEVDLHINYNEMHLVTNILVMSTSISYVCSQTTRGEVGSSFTRLPCYILFKLKVISV